MKRLKKINWALLGVLSALAGFWVGVAVLLHA